jgi:hypothetical protein
MLLLWYMIAYVTENDAAFYVCVHRSLSFLVGSKEVLSQTMMEGEQI